MIHRAAISQCVSVEEHPDPGPSGSLELDECTRDAECTTRAHGFCGQLDDIHPRNSCFYGCIVDADCGGGEICLCGVDPAAHLTSPAPVGTCVPADCTSDSDCLPGFHCALYDANPSCFSHAFSCQRLGDACGGDVDCDNGQVCTLGDGDPLGLENMLRSCAEPRCAVGRPFLVANEVRAATAIRRSDWTAPLTELRLEGMSAVLASRLAAEWTRAGQLEHASIAAFARFVFELLALGAPADLVADATRAMADETEHARTCFAFASSFRTRRVGPSTLDVSGALDGVSFPSAVRSAVIEGCIGETLAAIEAEEASERALEPTIKSALRRIAEDERRHAALAWRFVRWALDQGDSKLACLVEDTFERAALECRDDSPGVDHDVPSDADDAELLEFGVLPCRMRRTLRSNAFAAVIGPCARALLQCVSLDRRFAPLAPPRRTLEPRS
jgi:hypothetical protein